MGYRMVELELTEPLRALTAQDGVEGVAVLVRRAGVPVGFWMELFAGRAAIGVDALARRIAQHVGSDLLHPVLGDELSLVRQQRDGDPDESEKAYSVPIPTLKLTVAICTRDRPEWLARCLRSLVVVIGDRPAGCQVEVLVVDNASSGSATRGAVEGFGGVRYVFEAVPGLDFARNRALAEAQGELLAFLDDDVVVDRGWLEGLQAAWLDHPEAGGFAGLVLPLELETPAQLLFERRGGFGRGFRRIRYREGHLGDARFPLNAGKIGTGANMAIRCALVRALGGFDEALDTGPPLPGGGDLDMFYRVIRAGHDFIYDPRYLVFHHHRRELAALRGQLHSWGTGPMAMLAKVYAAEPEQRGKVRAQLRWWFADQARRLAASVVKRRLPTQLVLAELQGGVQGLLGEYGRSRKRVALRKQRYA